MHLYGLPALFGSVWQLVCQLPVWGSDCPLISGWSLPHQGGFGVSQPWTAARAEKRLSHVNYVPGGCWSCWMLEPFFNLNCEEPQPYPEAVGSSKMLDFPLSRGRNLFSPPLVAVPDLCLSRVSEDEGCVLLWKLRLHRCWQPPLTDLWEPLANATYLEPVCFSWV